jgi:hypothetical protein
MPLGRTVVLRAVALGIAVQAVSSAAGRAQFAIK